MSDLHCADCGTLLEVSSLSGYGLYWCPVCETDTGYFLEGDQEQVFDDIRMTSGRVWGFRVYRRFWSKVLMGEDDECWTWCGATSTKGYGRFKIGGRLFLPHRISYETACGPILKGLWVLHECDNPACVNPLHLFIGDRSDNMKDAHLKGRLRLPNNSGERNSSHKLNGADVRFIRRALARGALGVDLAAAYGVSTSTVSRIKNGIQWKHVRGMGELTGGEFKGD